MIHGKLDESMHCQAVPNGKPQRRRVLVLCMDQNTWRQAWDMVCWRSKTVYTVVVSEVLDPHPETNNLFVSYLPSASFGSKLETNDA